MKRALTIAVAWRFTQMTMPSVVDAATFPVIADLSRRAEELPVFRAAPFGSDAIVGDVHSTSTSRHRDHFANN